MQCKYCGAELRGNWCPKCGKTANAGGLGKSSKAVKPGTAPQKVVPPRDSNTVQDRFNSHLSGFGDRAKQELKHQAAVKSSGPDWGGQKRVEKRSRFLELVFTAVLLLSGIILFVSFLMPFFSTLAAVVEGETIPGATYTGLQSFGAGGGAGLWIILAFIFTIILVVVTILRLLVVMGKLQIVKILDTPVGSTIITGAGLAVAVFSFLVYSAVSYMISQGLNGQPVMGTNLIDPEYGNGTGINMLMPFGFITLGVAIGVIIVRLITLTNYKQAVKPTVDTARAAREQGNNFGFGAKQNTFNRAKEVYTPAPVRTMADTVGDPIPKYEPEPMDMEQYPVDENGNPIMPTEEELANGMVGQGYAPQEQQMETAPVVAPRPVPPSGPAVAPQAPIVEPVAQAEPVAEPEPEVVAPVAETVVPEAAPAKISPAEAARQRLAEAKAKLEAAKKAKGE